MGKEYNSVELFPQRYTFSMEYELVSSFLIVVVELQGVLCNIIL